MKSYLILLLFVAMFFVVTKSEEENVTEPSDEDIMTTTTENPLARTGPEEYGKREKLATDIEGLENFAILYLPNHYNYSNIIEAYREVKDGIRYEVLANATNERNVTVYCNLTILEKPWYITPWETRLRILEKSNCSSKVEIKFLNDLNQADQAYVDPDYQNNTIIKPSSNNLSKASTIKDSQKEEKLIDSTISKKNQNTVQNSFSVTAANDATIVNEETISTTTVAFDPINSSQSPSLSGRFDSNIDTAGNANINNAAQDQQNIYVTTETIIQTSESHPTGIREPLKPTLVGLSNMALVYLPRDLTFDKVLEAYREVINGIRYDVIVQATRSDNSEIICELQVQEKPWLLTPWGDKVRVLEKSNCSNSDDINNINDRNHIDQAYIDDKYNNNTIFNPTVKHVSDDILDQIESSILDPKKKSIHVTTSRIRFQTTTRRPIQPIQPATATNFQQQTLNQQQNFKNDQQQQQQTTGQISNDDKQFLDNFFNYFNVNDETTISTAAIGQENQISDQQSHHSHHHHHNHNLRNKRSPKKYNLKRTDHLFDKFQRKFNRVYESQFEKQKRYQIFKSNLIKINQLNKMEQGTAKYGITEFADMTTAEFKMRTGLLYDPESNRIPNPLADIPNDIPLPKEFDWRTKNVITEVKDQGQCGSCWAFSTIGNIEGLHAIKTGNLEEYSEQELVDCDTIDKGCGGGLMDDAYKAIEQLGGLELENEYPYEGYKDQCRFNKTKIHVKVKGGVDLPKNETAMALWLVQNGPISIGLNANAMMFYRGGISHPWSVLCRKGGIDHGVLIVGFGVSEYPVYKKTLPYWIIKNSWGKHWGEQGYYRLYRGDNTCGVSSMASSAVLE